MAKKWLSKLTIGSFAKTDMRYWQERVFFPAYTRNGKKFVSSHYAARIQHLSRRETFPLHTANKAAAAARAKHICSFLTAHGWEETLARFKPNPTNVTAQVVTVGDLIREVKAGATGSGRTLDDYCRNFRKLVAEVFGIDGGTQKYDYQKGGRQAWLEKVDGVKLSDLTPELIQKWKVSFVRRAGKNPAKQRAAKITVNSTRGSLAACFLPSGLHFLV